MAPDKSLSKKCVICKVNTELNSDNKYIICSGSCGGVIHHVCAPFKPTELKLFEKYTNVKWFCDQCNGDVLSGISGKPDQLILNKVAELAKKLEDCMTVVNNQSLQIVNLTNLLMNPKPYNENKKRQVAASSEKKTETPKNKINNLNNANIPTITNDNNATDNLADVASSSGSDPNVSEGRSQYASKLRSNSVNNNKQQAETTKTDHKVASTNVNNTKEAGQTIEPGDGFQIQKRRRKTRRQFGTATATTEESTGFLGAGQKVWLYISRIKYDVTKSQVLDHLTTKTGRKQDEFTVHDLTTESSTTRSFRIGADFALKDQLYSTDFWPSRVAYCRYDFRKNPNNEKQNNYFFGTRPHAQRQT